MNILLSARSGHDKTEGIHYYRVLRRLGHEVFWVKDTKYFNVPGRHLKPEPGLALDTSLPAILSMIASKVDLFLYIEPQGIIPPGIEHADFNTACVLCDVHRDLASRQGWARFFDHVFIYHRNYLEAFREHPEGHVYWLPYACDLEFCKPLGVPRDLDIAFIGQSIPGSGRARILSELSRRYKINEPRYYLQEEISLVYSRAQIVLNLPLGDDLNFRTFEAMSCGAMLLTRRIANGQEVLFQEGVHFEAFSDEKELFDKIDYYLAHPQEREAIAAAGLAEVRQHHRLEQRIERLLEIVKKNPDKAAPIRRMTPAQIDLQYAWLYESWREIAPGLNLVRTARRAGRGWLPLLVPAARTFLRLALR
jgi:glycosyltransferase involved in cell wall biosynthesis